MLTYRKFRNFDPPTIAAIWRSRAGQPGLVQPVSPDLLEQLVFAKLYFDYPGLVLAYDGERPVGFAHAGFGPNAEESAISTEVGATCAVVTDPAGPEAEVAVGLVERCEEYLRSRGAKVFYGGGVRPMCPFYIGLYGGAEPPGVLDSDVVARNAFTARGYREVERTVSLRRDLDGFEAQVDRLQMQVRRQMIVEVTVDAPTRTWWEACLWGEFELTRFELVPRVGGPAVATALFRGMEPAGTTGVGRAAGLLGLSVEAAYRRRGLGLFLMNEAFRQFIRQGIMHVDMQTSETNAAALALFQKLGLQETGRGGVWRKIAD